MTDVVATAAPVAPAPSADEPPTPRSKRRGGVLGWPGG